jgi:hypothetical protein
MNLKNIIVASTLVIGAIFTTSCERIADRDIKYSNNWRARCLQSNAILTVTNPDSVDVLKGDTVLVVCIDGGTYDILNTDVRRDSTYGFFNLDSTEYTSVEQRVVMLEKRSLK